jgi:hypothetical protein
VKVCDLLDCKLSVNWIHCISSSCQRVCKKSVLPLQPGFVFCWHSFCEGNQSIYEISEFFQWIGIPILSALPAMKRGWWLCLDFSISSCDLMCNLIFKIDGHNPDDLLMRNGRYEHPPEWQWSVVFLSAWITIAINQLQLKFEDSFCPCSEHMHESESEHYRTTLHDGTTWSYFWKLTSIQSSKELTKNYVKTFERCSRYLFVELQRDWQCSLSQLSRRMCRTEILADLWSACQFANGCGGWAA